jgi:hypothetical protein
MNEKQTQILQFLEDLHQEVTNGNLKAIDAIKRKHGISGSVAVVVGILKIVEKVNGYYQWSADEAPSKKMALIVDEADRTYNRNTGKLALFKPLIECETGEKKFIYDLKDFWEVPGYTRKDNARRAIIQSFTKNEDYITVLNKEDGTNENTGRSEDGKFAEENILMTLTCLKLFVAMAQTPIGRHFAEKFIRHSENESTKYLKHSKEISLKGQKIRDFEELSAMVRNFQNKLAASNEVLVREGPPSLNDFDKMIFWQTISDFAQTVNELIMRGYPTQQLNGNGIETKQLSEGSKALLLA